MDKQYIGNLGKTANGIVSVNAYAIVDRITYPRLFKIYKPRSRLKANDVSRSASVNLTMYFFAIKDDRGKQSLETTGRSHYDCIHLKLLWAAGVDVESLAN